MKVALLLFENDVYRKNKVRVNLNLQFIHQTQGREFCQD
jgi:hypothetical protein